MVIDDEIQYEWARIPHFYRPFYVYKYATGYSTAVALSEGGILKEGEPAVKRSTRSSSPWAAALTRWTSCATPVLTWPPRPPWTPPPREVRERILDDAEATLAKLQ